MFYGIFVQFLAILFLLLFAISYHAKTRKLMLSIQILGSLALIFHFILLHAWSGFAMQTVHLIAIVLFLFKEKRNILKSKFLLCFFFLTYFVFTIITWQGYFSIFAFLGISSGTFAKWQTKPNSIRMILIICGIFWIIYDFFVNSYGGIISESLLLISAVISLIRNRKKL
jgi:hypothetical protein